MLYHLFRILLHLIYYIIISSCELCCCYSKIIKVFFQMSCLCPRQNAGCHTKGLPQGSGSPVVRSMVQTQHFDKFFIISSPSQISSPEITKESWTGQALTQPTPRHPPHQHALQHATLDFFGGGATNLILAKFISCQCKLANVGIHVGMFFLLQ